MDLSDPKNHKIIPKLSEEVYKLVNKYEGSISGEHNDGLIRGPFLKQMYGAKMYGLFKQTKEIFDPKNIFNPGKKIGASLDYAMSHLKNSE
jgi:FAD/FMN-containing dehydrogenase